MITAIVISVAIVVFCVLNRTRNLFSTDSAKFVAGDIVVDVDDDVDIVDGDLVDDMDDMDGDDDRNMVCRAVSDDGENMGESDVDVWLVGFL